MFLEALSSFSRTWRKFDAISRRLPFPVGRCRHREPRSSFPGKRRTLEILARNVGSGERERGDGRNSRRGRPPWLGGISFPWRLPANATLPPYRGRRRRHRRRRVCSCSCAPWFRFRSPTRPYPPSPPRCPPSSRFELPPTPRAHRVLPHPLSDVLLSLPFVPPSPPAGTTLFRHPRWNSSFQLPCDARYRR